MRRKRYIQSDQPAQKKLKSVNHTITMIYSCLTAPLLFAQRKLRIFFIYKVQDTRLRMPNKWHICREGQAGNKNRQLLVFSELPSLPSADSQPGFFHTSLGCEPRSLIRVSLGCSIIRKDVRNENPTPAYSPVSDRRRLTALVEIFFF
jgi:hypothetical protein